MCILSQIVLVVYLHLLCTKPLATAVENWDYTLNISLAWHRPQTDKDVPSALSNVAYIETINVFSFRILCKCFEGDTLTDSKLKILVPLVKYCYTLS